MMYSTYIKRMIDVFISLLTIPAFILMFLLFAPLIYLEDKGSFFFFAQRLGKGGQIFYMIKFRTMTENAPDIRLPDGSTYNSDDDPRLTKIGKFLRKTSIDEIPQIINVIKGEMSIIGPRPDTIDSLANYTSEEKTILSIRPGITGFNQAYYRNSIGSKQKLKNDIYYVNNISFLLDLKILFKTVKTVLLKENVTNS